MFIQSISIKCEAFRLDKKTDTYVSVFYFNKIRD